MVDVTAPDLERFPRFAEAMIAAQVAELAPGDGVYIPYMWWHHVESCDPISVLANYWWSATPAQPSGPTPQDALVLARLAFVGASPEQRAAWRAMFDHVVFEPEEPSHLPPARRGLRGAIGEPAMTRLKRQLGEELLRGSQPPAAEARVVVDSRSAPARPPHPSDECAKRSVDRA